MEELHSLDPRRQELLEARFTGAVSGNTVGSTGSTSGGAKVTAAQKALFLRRNTHFRQEPHELKVKVYYAGLLVTVCKHAHQQNSK